MDYTSSATTMQTGIKYFFISVHVNRAFIKRAGPQNSTACSVILVITDMDY